MALRVLACRAALWRRLSRWVGRRATTAEERRLRAEVSVLSATVADLERRLAKATADATAREDEVEALLHANRRTMAMLRAEQSEYNARTAAGETSAARGSRK